MRTSIQAGASVASDLGIAPHRNFLASLVSIAFIGAIGIFLLYSIWDRTGEIFQDFGTELYRSWQISQGKVLYRDMSCPYGALSAQLNAAIMKIFGSGVRPILVANLLWLVATAFLLHRLVRLIAGRFTATVAVSFFLMVFALSCPTRIVNYDYLTPYAHEITHGFLLCLATLYCIDRFLERGSTIAVAAGGLSTGLALLTKPEIFLGCFPMYVVGIVFAFWLRRFNVAAPNILAAIGGLVTGPLLAFWYFATQMPARTAMAAVLGAWQYANQSSTLSTPFYRGSFGIDQPWRNTMLMLAYAACSILGSFLLAGCALLFRGNSKKTAYALVISAILLGCTCFAAIFFADHWIPLFWIENGKGLPIIVVLIIALNTRALINHRRIAANLRGKLLAFCFSMLALAFLSKIILAARIYQYGFVLAVPGAILSVVALLRWLPDWVRQRGGGPAIVRAGAIGIFTAIGLKYVVMTRHIIAERTVPVPLANGQLAWTTPDRADLISALNYLRRYPSANLAALPDCAGLNYAAGLPNPLPFIVLDPMYLNWHGESNVINAFAQNPPRFILIVSVFDDAFGAHMFGQDFGIELRKWIESRYKPLADFSTTQHPARLWMLR